MHGVPPDSILGQGDEYVMGLEPEQREIYEDRVETFRDWGMELPDAQAVARSDAPKTLVRKLLRDGCSIDTLRRIVA